MQRVNPLLPWSGLVYLSYSYSSIPLVSAPFWHGHGTDMKDPSVNLALTLGSW